MSNPIFVGGVGRLTKDLEVKKSASGKTFIDFDLACADPRRAKGEDRATCFLKLVCGGQPAEFLARNAHKGDQVEFLGHYSVNHWKDKSGAVRNTVQILVRDISIVSYAKANVNAGAKEGPIAPPKDGEVENDNECDGTANDDDLPF